MKRKVILILVGAVLLFSGILFILQNNGKETTEGKAANYTIEESIDTEVNNPNMTYEEFVINTLKSYLKSERSVETTLYSENGQLNYSQLKNIYDGFFYVPDGDIENVGEITIDSSGVTTHAINQDTEMEFGFFAENEGWRPIPAYIIIQGNFETANVAYEAIAEFNNETLDLWEEYSEKPVFDEEKNVTKWLAVFKLPLEELPDDDMGIKLSVSLNGELFE